MGKKLTTEEFIKRSNEKHEGKYFYDKTIYIKSSEHVIVTCKTHGDFLQIPSVHLSGHGCPKCSSTLTPTKSILKTNNFIERSNIKHKNKYIYDKTIYINTKEKVIITCPIHGDFEQTAGNHLYGYGCSECGKITNIINKTNTLENFINTSNEKHNFKYDYSKSKYINSHTKTTIICPIHGEFEQITGDHMDGSACPKCAGKYMDTELFIEKSKLKHGEKYDYSKTEYINSFTNVTIICKTHGEFLQLPSHHMNGSGCKKCNFEKPNICLSNTEEFIEKAKIKHENKYSYDKTTYVNGRNNVIITCPIHGDFKQTPFGHLQGNGCQKCSYIARAEKLTIKQEDVIKRFIETHGNKYDYSKVIYTGTENKIIIICPEHGEFIQTPHAHLMKQGCSKCFESKLETTVRVLLENNNIDYVYEQKFSWLGNKQSVDFYLPTYNTAIECQGEQHFNSVEFFGGEKRHEGILKLDEKKNKLSLKNNVKLLYFSDIIVGEYKLGEVINDKNELLEQILNN